MLTQQSLSPIRIMPQFTEDRLKQTFYIIEPTQSANGLLFFFSSRIQSPYHSILDEHKFLSVFFFKMGFTDIDFIINFANTIPIFKDF